MRPDKEKSSLGEASEDEYSNLGDQEWWDLVSARSEEELMTPSKAKRSFRAAAPMPESPTPATQNSRVSGSSTSQAGKHTHTEALPLSRSLSLKMLQTISKRFDHHSGSETESPSSTSARRRSSSGRQVPVYTVVDSDTDESADPDVATDTDSDHSSSVDTSRSNVLSTSTSASSVGLDAIPPEGQTSIATKLKGLSLATPKSKGLTSSHVAQTSRSAHRSSLTSTCRPVRISLPPPSTSGDTNPNKAPAEARVDPVNKLQISENLSKANVDPQSFVTRFLDLPLGQALDPFLVAHNSSIQRLLDDMRVEWGVQWELARGVSRGLWTWDAIAGRITRLVGSNQTTAPKVPEIMDKMILSSTSLNVWKEMDREERASREDHGRRLGLKGAWEGDGNWHGGQIQQIIRLVKPEKPDKESKHKYKVVLEPLEMKRSNRFSRFLGSRHLLQLKINDNVVMEERAAVTTFLAQKFVLMGRVFVPFHSKDGGVYMVETDENYERSPQAWFLDEERMSFVQFMEWHNPLVHNSRQAISKYATRFALGLSNSVPSLEFDPGSIFFIDDVYASDWPIGKPGAPTEKIMTDGCGFINLAGLKAVTKHMGYEFPPAAIQGRIDGSKGMWVRHPTDDSSTPRIWIRASQNKIKNPCLDRAHCIFELLGPSRPYIGSSLKQQPILNLYHNGVSAEALIKLFEEGLKEEVIPLLSWDNMTLLWNAVSRAGGVSGARLARLAASKSRALGLQGGQWGHDDVDSTENPEGHEDLGPATFTGRNPYSGAPLLIYEKILDYIQAGFHAKQATFLQDDLKKAVTTTINSAIEKYRIPLNDSLAAFVIPDPYAVQPMQHPSGAVIVDPFGVLEEGQIYYRSSVPLKDPVTEMQFDVITGQVIVGRYPMRLPSDLQKVTAVDVPALSSYLDIVIASVKGERSLASLLSGGDMDGDVLYIYREPELVEDFVNQPFTGPPVNLRDDFESHVETVSTFCQRMVESVSPEEAAKEYQHVLLANLETPIKGLYSMFHDQAVAKVGYSHPDTVRLAYIFNLLLDAAKSGDRLKDGVFERDKKLWGAKPEPFGVLAKLKEAGARISAELLEQFIKTSEGSGERWDRHLLAPYKLACERVIHLVDTKSPLKDEYVREMDLIRKHVGEANTLFKDAATRSLRDKETQSTGGKGKSKARTNRYDSAKSDQKDIMLPAAKKFQEEIEGIYHIWNLSEVKASFAYTLGARFGWAVAHTDLCGIQARAHPSGWAPVTRDIDNSRTIISGIVRALSTAAEDEVF